MVIDASHPVALAILILIVTCSTATVPQGNRDKEHLIRNQLAAYAAARQRGDAVAQAAFYTPDAETKAWFSATITQGRNAIAKELEVPNPYFRLEIENISFLRSDLAFVDTKYYGASPQPAGHAFYVMVKQAGTWLIRVRRTAGFRPCS